MANNNNTGQAQQNWFNPFESWQLPNMDLNAWNQQLNKNMKVIAAANQTMLECAKESGRRMADMVQNNSKNMMNCMQESMCCNNPAEAQHKQQNMAATIMQTTVAQLKEAADIYSKATKEVLELYNKRFQETVNETK